MGAEIVRVSREHFPSLRFIGKCYTNHDRGADGGFGGQWQAWFQHGWFEQLESLGVLGGIETGSIGLMGCSERENSFQYWIGYFFPEYTPVPEGFSSVDIPAGDVGLCWIRGRSDTGEIYGEKPHKQCMEALKQHGMGRFRDDFKAETEKWWWFFERYNCPRFTKKQDDGTVILDYGIYIESGSITE